MEYREPKWPEGKVAPYQVKLCDGRKIFAPLDDERVIRKFDGELPPEPVDPSKIADKSKLPVTIGTRFDVISVV